MKRLKYSIDKLELNKSKEIEVEGWVICKGEYTIYFMVDEIEYREIKINNSRPDVLSKVKGATLQCGFIERIQLPKKEWNRISVKIKYNGKEKILCSKSKMEIFNNKILYHIDTLRVEKDKIKMVGWAFSEDGSEITIECQGIQNENVKHVLREDVRKQYEICSHNEVGFMIEGNLIQNKLYLKFKSGEQERVKEINVWAYKYKTKLNKLVRLGVYINMTNIKKAMNCIKKNGMKACLNKVEQKLRMNPLENITYEEWLKRHNPTDKELKEQRKKSFKVEPKISILVPTYNTPKRFLVEMLDSVVEQTYANWELCIADGSDKRDQVKEILEQYQAKDKRIKVKYLESNLGISDNTNACIEMATGDFIGLFDHDDLLAPNALYEIVSALNEDKEIDFIYTDEDKVDEHSRRYFDAHFKPDWAPDTLRSYNYICHFVVFKKSLLEKVGGFRKEFDGSQDYDMVLRLTEKAAQIKHIPKVLYHWRVHQNSTAKQGSAKSYTVDAGLQALQAHLSRIGQDGQVELGLREGTYRVKYNIQNEHKVSIIIPNKDYKEDLEKCINSIFEKTTYSNYEIIIVENNSETEEIFEYYEILKKNERIKVVRWADEFNYSKINNYGAQFATGQYYILLNNDIEILTPNWIEEMLMHCQREQVGIVGAKLYYPDDTIQHAGVIIGLGGVAGHSHKYFSRDDDGYFSRTKIIQNLSAVTAACLMVRKDVFDEVEGLDEKFKVAFNDVDFCLRVGELGKLVIFTPYVECYHYESKSRGIEDSPEKIERFKGEINLFISRWGENRRDPYYSDNLTLDTENFAIRSN